MGWRRSRDHSCIGYPGIALEFNREQPPLTGTLFVTEEAIFPSQTRKSPTTGANRHQPKAAKIREEVAGSNPVTPTICDVLALVSGDFRNLKGDGNVTRPWNWGGIGVRRRVAWPDAGRLLADWADRTLQLTRISL